MNGIVPPQTMVRSLVPKTIRHPALNPPSCCRAIPSRRSASLGLISRRQIRARTPSDVILKLIWMIQPLAGTLRCRPGSGWQRPLVARDPEESAWSPFGLFCLCQQELSDPQRVTNPSRPGFPAAGFFCSSWRKCLGMKSYQALRLNRLGHLSDAAYYWASSVTELGTED